MSIVPLNFGAALFMANPHFVQVDAVSGFWVPQFGQNTENLRRDESYDANDETGTPASIAAGILRVKG
jgi:hypothetical protein